MNQEILNKYRKNAFLEVKEHLETIRLVIENLPIYLKNKPQLEEELQKIYRATFCLRGFFGMFGYLNPIQGYGLDECLRFLAKSNDLIITDEVLQLLLKLIDLQEKYVNLIEKNCHPETYQNLFSESEITLKKIKSNLEIIDE